MAKATKKDRALIDQAMKRLKTAVDAESENRDAAIDDLKFLNGEQWDARELKRRKDKGRPALTLNFLPKFVDQVVGDMLHNSPAIKVRPIDASADLKIAAIRQGIIAGIEYQSNAKGIYHYAAKQMVSCGYGGWRVLTRYTEENPFLQEIYLEGIRNPFLIYLDPTAKDQNYADAKWGFLIEKIPLEEFKERYPTAAYPSASLEGGKGTADELWFDGETVTVAEYFSKESEPVEMLQLHDGRVMTEEEYKETRKEWKEEVAELQEKIAQARMMPMPPMMPGMPPMPSPVVALEAQLKALGDEPKIAKKRMTDKTVIRHRIMSCMEILFGGTEGHIFPGKYIPLVLVKGKELNIEGKNIVYSLIRHAKDAIKLNNYWNTSAAETIALAPKAPWLMTPKQIEGHENSYAAANIENFPVLLYNVDPEAPGMPQRLSPGQPPQAIFEQIRRGEENLKSIIGMFNADVGGPISQQTGIAVQAMQRPGDIATFEFGENLARAVLYTGRVINEMIPDIYDTERDVRVKNLDDSETFVPINTTVESALESIQEKPEMYQGLDVEKLRTIFAKDGKDTKYNDITVGKYDIQVSTGPSYATRRQESAQHLLQLTQSMPQQMASAADLIVRNLDFKDAEELEARLRKPLVAQGIVRPRPGESVPQPPPPPPEVQLAQIKLQSEQGKQQLLQIKARQETVKLEIEKVRLQLELVKFQAEQGDSGTDRLSLIERAKALRIEDEKLELEKAKFLHQRSKDIHDGQIEEGKLTMQAIKGLQGAVGR